MKTLPVMLLLFAASALVLGTASLTGTAHAQNDPYILLRIATQADEQIINQLDAIYGDAIPSDIQGLYQDGHTAVQSLGDSLPDDVAAAQENFLVAMKTFKQITRMLSVSATSDDATSDTMSGTNNRDLESELNRLHKYFQNIKTISEKHDTGIDLSDIERLFAGAHDQINSGEFEAAIQTIEQLESLIKTIRQDISEHESHSTPDRSKNFALKQLDKIKAVLDGAANHPETPELREANALVAEIETLISEDKISDAKKKFTELVKLVEIIKDRQLES